MVLVKMSQQIITVPRTVLALWTDEETAPLCTALRLLVPLKVDEQFISARRSVLAFRAHKSTMHNTIRTGRVSCNEAIGVDAALRAEEFLHGARGRVLYGGWCMADGVWCMVYGVWRMVYGVWCMVCECGV
jgi:hypothetical protein